MTKCKFCDKEAEDFLIIESEEVPLCLIHYNMMTMESFEDSRGVDRW